ncbi:hypothetical protein DRE_00207 [Drechslerella stenobrocha 248]|uniref:Uncharacterized protein n=1 Tax=Drechslerella stenobrocha 248 TaxID=1043628 RepID=W7I9X1_9PEZI|nr:hypothetical protein DRE_00207 [Drechslerella stenobrocha 248]
MATAPEPSGSKAWSLANQSIVDRINGCSIISQSIQAEFARLLTRPSDGQAVSIRHEIHLLMICVACLYHFDDLVDAFMHLTTGIQLRELPILLLQQLSYVLDARRALIPHAGDCDSDLRAGPGEHCGFGCACAGTAVESDTEKQAALRQARRNLGGFQYEIRCIERQMRRSAARPETNQNAPDYREAFRAIGRFSEQYRHCCTMLSRAKTCRASAAFVTQKESMLGKVYSVEARLAEALRLAVGNRQYHFVKRGERMRFLPAEECWKGEILAECLNRGEGQEDWLCFCHLKYENLRCSRSV